MKSSTGLGIGVALLYGCTAAVAFTPTHSATIPPPTHSSPALQGILPNYRACQIPQGCPSLDRLRSPTQTSTALQAVPGGRKHATTLAGRLWPAIRKFYITPAKFKAIVAAVVHITDWQDIILIGIVAYGINPLARLTFDMMSDEKKEKRTYFDRKRFGVASTIAQIARVSLSVYIFDVICVILTTLDFDFPTKWMLPQAYSKIAYSTWFLQHFILWKRMALCKWFKVDPEDMGRIELLDRVVSGLAGATYSLFLFDWLSIRMGFASTYACCLSLYLFTSACSQYIILFFQRTYYITSVKGIFAFGSVGTLAFTLASQGLVTQLISGLFLTATDKMYVGDAVQFGDGTSGKIIRMGWMNTLIRNGDNTITNVPNAMLANQKITNLSRLRQCQVKQVLRFHYDDADLLPEVLESIKTEIKQSCPKLIDGNRPFRVFWTGYNEDHLEVMVDTHHSIAPIGDAYWINRQKVLMAINRAVKKHNVEIAQMYSFATSGSEPSWRVIPKSTMTINPKKESASKE
jgi:hypothetical protein